MGISLLRFNAAEVAPKDDAVLFNYLIGGTGIMAGCGITHLGGNQLQIAAGRGIIQGRDFVVTLQTILATVADSGTKLGRLLIEIDIENTGTPISFVTQMGATLPDLTQEDINGDGTVYQLPIATYDISQVAISNLEVLSNGLPAIKEHTHSGDDINAGTLPLARGGTGATSAAAARTALGAAAAAWSLIKSQELVSGSNSISISSQAGKAELLVCLCYSTSKGPGYTVVVPLAADGMPANSTSRVVDLLFRHTGDAPTPFSMAGLTFNSATSLSIAPSVPAGYGYYGGTTLKIYSR